MAARKENSKMSIMRQAAEKRLKDLAIDIMYEAISPDAIATQALVSMVENIALHQRIDDLLKELWEYEEACTCWENRAEEYNGPENS